MSPLKAAWLHLRVPFSILLMPVYLFALGIAPGFSWLNAAIAFVAIHLFLYPASNGYNSYYDKDEGSIGGLEHPPAVNELLWRLSLAFDAIAVALGLFISWEFALALLFYGLVSKAYSHDRIRLKKYPVASWLVVGIFQGFFIFVAVYQAIHQASWRETFSWPVLFPAFLSSAMLMGSYPMSQIYQHAEDGKRGDLTLSRLLGLQGTFAFTAVFFSLAIGGFGYYFYLTGKVYWFAWMLVMLAPVLAYFLWWWWQVRNEPGKANYRLTMQLNLISAACLNLFFFSSILAHFFP
jgi:1,4-dihydroxy-2-naphthoate octaprenyltransferase